MRPIATARGALVAAIVSLLALAVAAPSAGAQASSARFAAGSGATQTAQAIARAHWGVDPCGGAVEIDWTPLATNVNAVASWVTARRGSAAPRTNGECRIAFNRRLRFGWAKFCTVLVHEYGHLVGHGHDARPGRLMSAYYAGPLPECSAALRRAAAKRKAARRR